MKDVKRMFSLLTSLTLLLANMTAVSVSADETDTDIWAVFQEEAGAGIEVVEKEGGYFPEVIDKETVFTENENVESSEESADETAGGTENDESAESDNQPVENEQAEEPSQPEEPQNTEFYAEVAEGDPEPQAGSENIAFGDIEGLVNKKVFQVTLPVGNRTLEYTADPQGLVYRTQTAKYPDSFFDPGATVYFNNGEILSDSGKLITHYSDVSDPLTVVNKSSCAVEVVARVRADYKQDVKNPVAIAPDRNWENVLRPSICISVIKSDDLSEVVLSRKEKIITASIPGCPDMYRYIYEEGDEGASQYDYRMMNAEELAEFRADPENADKDTTFKDFSLYLTAECNKDGEWDHETEYDFPIASIVWNVGFAASARPCITNTEYSVAYGTEIEIPYSLGAFDSAASAVTGAQYISGDEVIAQLAGDEKYIDISDSVITLKEEFVRLAEENNGGLVRFEFDDPDQTVIDVTLDRDAAPSLKETGCYISADKSCQISIDYDLGTGNKAATGISQISFGSFDFSTNAHSAVGKDRIVLNAGSVRIIQMKNGGKVYITFDDPAHTRCGFKINIEKD